MTKAKTMDLLRSLPSLLALALDETVEKAKTMRGARGTVTVLAIVLSFSCAGPRESDAPATREGLRLIVVSHGQSSDAFWSVVANGVHDAADDLGVRVEYQAPTSFDMVRMSELIDAAIVSRPSALIVSIPDPVALRNSIQAAISAGIPVLGINSGADAWKTLGLVGYVGQTEYEAGRGAGERLGSEGVTRAVCVNHEVGNASLDERCRGLADALAGTGGSTSVLAVDLADPDDAQQRVASFLSGDAGIDGMLALGPAGAVPSLAALRSTGRAGVRFGTFDLGPDVLQAVVDGEMAFAIDQQPYLQGYLAVVLMTKYVEAGVMPGGGELIRTGPSFVTAANAANVMRLTEQGIR
jgi:simple sugar transport system substrate-binding protein